MIERADQLVLNYVSKAADAAHGVLRADQRLDFAGRLRARVEAERRGSQDAREVAKVLARFGDPVELVEREARRLAGQGVPTARDTALAGDTPSAADAVSAANTVSAGDVVSAGPAAAGAAGPPSCVRAAEEALVRAAQEGLANVRKHARAGSARLTLEHVRGSAVRLSISDDGCGFDPATAPEGYGLRAMRSRVGRLGGTVRVAGSPGLGTTVAVEVPCSGC